MNRVALIAFLLSASSLGYSQTATDPTGTKPAPGLNFDCHAGARVDLDHLFSAPCADSNQRPVFTASLGSLPVPLVLHPLPHPGVPIPTQWPDLKTEKIPTQWPNLKLLPIKEKAQGMVAGK